MHGWYKIVRGVYCGFINIQGYQFSWIKWQLQLQGYVNSWPMAISIQNVNKNCTFMNVLFRGSTMQRNPRKLVFKEYRWNHSTQLHKQTSKRLKLCLYQISKIMIKKEIKNFYILLKSCYCTFFCLI